MHAVWFPSKLLRQDEVTHGWLATGDTARNWRVEPFVMLEGGQRWLPPPMTAIAGSGSHQTAAQRGGELRVGHNLSSDSLQYTADKRVRSADEQKIMSTDPDTTENSAFRARYASDVAHKAFQSVQCSSRLAVALVTQKRSPCCPLSRRCPTSTALPPLQAAELTST